MSDKNKISVEIFGQMYTVKGDTSAQHVRLVAGYVDDKMRQLSTRAKSLDTNKLAVLTAVNVADEYFRLKEEHESLLKIVAQLKER